MKFKDSIEVLRPVNCVMGALTVVIGLLNTRVGVPLDKLLINIFLGVLTYIFIAGAGNIINDIYDYNSGIDIINRPERPLPSERITVKEAVYVWLISLIVGISISAIHSFLFSLGLLPVAIVSLFGFLGWFYAKWGKQSGFFGNIVVSFSFSMGMIYGAIIHNAIIPNYIYYFFLTSFFLLLSREIIKGCEDIEGDKNQGVKTLAIVIGIKKSTIIALFFALIAIIFFILPIFTNIINPILFTIFLFFGLFVVGIAIVFMVKPRLTRQNFKRISLTLKVGAFIGLMTFLLTSI